MIFSDKIIDWYYKHGRVLPWRMECDPYKIWVSEIILQQTRVEQGISYYKRFIDRFPDVYTLASAGEDEVLKYWEGLGYYSRARNLHAAACQIVARGTFPDTYDEIRKLKGVGDYTASAVASFAFSLPYAVVDGNVYRVLARYLGISVPIDSTEGKRLFSQKAGELLDSTRASDYNQAIMDFGAMCCVPQNPDCGNCPLSGSCVAFRNGSVALLPVRQPRKPLRHRFFTFVYLIRNQKTALWKRGENDIWRGLYQPLMIEWEHGIPPLSAISDRLSVLLSTKISVLYPVDEPVTQRLSHQQLHASFYRLNLDGLPDGFILPHGAVWVPAEEVSMFAFPKMLAAHIRKNLLFFK